MIRLEVIDKTQLKFSPFGLTLRYLKVLTEFSQFHHNHFLQQELDLRARDTDGMQRETQTCHVCYGKNSMLVIKTNIVLEININSSFSAEKREGTGNLKNFFRILPIKFFILKLADQLATLQFKEVLKEKKRKHLPGSSKKIKKERLKENGGQTKKGGIFVRS